MSGSKKNTKCLLSADGESFTIRRGSWRDTLPISRIRSQIAFYERLRDRNGGDYAAHYAPTVDALHKLKDRIAESEG